MSEIGSELYADDGSTRVSVSQPLRTKASIWAFLLAVVGCVMTVGITPVAAQDGEFPADWYFDGMQKMRENLEGRPAPEISTDSWIGDATTLEESRGKVVVLDFWATWCGPCVASIPKNISMVSDHPDDIVFIGMHSATSGWDKAQKMVDDREINYPVVLDTGDTANAYEITGYPTYVIIDQDGIVRAAGVTPSHVKSIVEKLIQESGPYGNATRIVSLNREWFYSGASWMRSWQEQLGQPATPIRSTAWWLPGDGVPKTDDRASKEKRDNEAELEASSEIEAPDGYAETDLEGLVRVLHFTRPGMGITDKQLELLNETAKKYLPQGVVFTAICDRQSNWNQSRSLASKLDLRMPLVMDQVASAAKLDSDESEDGESETGDKSKGAAADTPSDSTNAEPSQTSPPGDSNQPAPREAGETARNYHIRIAPVTVLIDRQGRIRATGLRVDQLGDALDLLLAEQAG